MALPPAASQIRRLLELEGIRDHVLPHIAACAQDEYLPFERVLPAGGIIDDALQIPVGRSDGDVNAFAHRQHGVAGQDHVMLIADEAPEPPIFGRLDLHRRAVPHPPDAPLAVRGNEFSMLAEDRPVPTQKEQCVVERTAEFSVPFAYPNNHVRIGPARRMAQGIGLETRNLHGVTKVADKCLQEAHETARCGLGAKTGSRR